MTVWTCATCAIEHPDTPEPPEVCEICSDARQYVPAGGQRWTTQAELAARDHRLRFDELEPDLFGVSVEPRFGIGQRGLLVRTSAGNLLWEPPGFLDAVAVATVRRLGGVAAVAASHPHLVGCSVSWSRAFGGAPVLVAEADRRWVRRPDPAIELWKDVQEVLPGLTLVPCGGHFAGSAVAHWAAGAGGRGALLTGDTLGVGADRASVGVMRSWVNHVPLPPRAVRRIIEALHPWHFDRLYGGFATIDAGAEEAVHRSLERYLLWLDDRAPVDD